MPIKSVQELHKIADTDRSAIKSESKEIRLAV